MKINYLFPSTYKKIGWFILIPSAILGLITLLLEIEPDVLNLNIPTIYSSEIFEENQLFGIINDNVLNETLGTLVIISSLLVAFSKEKIDSIYTLFKSL